MEEMKLGRLIVVDDEVELMTTLCEMLAKEGYEAIGFTSGPDVLEAMQEKEFDLLLTDLMMPDMDGITLIKKALEMDPELWSIIMTGNGTIQTAVDAMKLGTFDYILKPFKLSTLLPVLARALEMRRIKMENLRLRETEAISDLSRAIAVSLDRKTILNNIADGAMEQCKADEASIMLPTQDGKGLYVAVVRGEDRETLEGQRIPIEEGISGWVARFQEPLILHGEVHDPRFVPIKPRQDIYSALCLPMMVGGKLVGILNVHTTHRGRPFTLGQVKALNILTSTAASALENTRLYTQLQEAEQKYKAIFENAHEAIFVVQDEKIVFANPKSLELSGYSIEEFISRPFIDFIHPDDRAVVIETYLKRIQGEKVSPSTSYRILDKVGYTKWVEPNVISIHWEGKPATLCFLNDISVRKQAEGRQGLFLRVLDLLNQIGEKGDLIRKILYLLKEETGIEAMGIRLREGEDFPYYETRGFSETFLEKGNYLCARDEKGEIIRDSQGNPSLECMCGNVLCRRTDPSLPFFTEVGSFWTNSMSELLASTTEEDRQTQTRNGCNGEGYESVALIPLRSGDEVIGLLQMNDRKPNQFSLDRIKFFEGIGSSVGIALARRQMEEALKKGEEKYRGIFENAVEGIFQTTLEGQFINVNPAMARIYGYASPEELKMAITDTAKQLFINPEDRIRYRKLLEDQGILTAFEALMKKKDGEKIWVSINAYTVKDPGGKILCFEGLTQDITQRKLSEKALQKSVTQLKKANEGIIQAIVMAVETRDPYTAGHQKRVATLAQAIALELGLTQQQIEAIRIAATIHDLGKISIPADILSKPTKLTEIEFSLIKTHSESGYRILRDIEFEFPLAQIVLQHHERFDGSGYPKGIKDQEILLEAKIIAVADVVEAMASFRPYRQALGIDKALEEILNSRGRLYEPRVVDACVRLFKEKGFTFD